MLEAKRDEDVLWYKVFACGSRKPGSRSYATKAKYVVRFLEYHACKLREYATRCHDVPIFTRALYVVWQKEGAYPSYLFSIVGRIFGKFPAPFLPFLAFMTIYEYILVWGSYYCYYHPRAQRAKFWRKKKTYSQKRVNIWPILLSLKKSTQPFSRSKSGNGALSLPPRSTCHEVQGHTFPFRVPYTRM